MLHPEPVEKIETQELNVVIPLSQWGHFQGQNLNSVVEILPQLPFLNHLSRISVGGSQESDVTLLLLSCPQASDTPVLQDTEQFGLQVNRHFRNFVQKQRAAVSLFETTGPGFPCSCKGTFLMAE